MKKMFLASLVSALILQSGCSSSQDDHDDPFSGVNLYNTVKKYVSLGEHRTGTDTDNVTSSWLRDDLAEAGYQTNYFEFPLKQFFPKTVAVAVGSDVYNAFPHWYIQEQHLGKTSGILSQGNDDQSVSGHIILTEFRFGAQGQIDPETLSNVQSLIKKGASGIIGYANYTGSSLIAFNAPDGGKPWPVPVVVVSQDDAQQLSQRTDKDATITIDGEFKDVIGRNIYGTIGKGEQYIVISTPISGWFRNGGERGPGLAVWLALAKWVATENFPYTFVFTGNSGHELAGLGAKLFLEKGAPPPEKTKLWLHLGAGIATRDWKKGNSGAPEWLDNTDPNRNFFFSESVRASFEEALNHLAGKKWEINERVGGELVYVIDKGYPHVSGIAYGHPYFHLTIDDEHTTSPRILEETARAFKQFIQLEAEK